MSEFLPVPPGFKYNAQFVRGSELERAIQDAREVVDETRNIPIATVTPEGNPYITVVSLGIPGTEALAVDIEKGAGFWGFDDAQRVRNLRHNNLASIAVFSSTENKGSLTIRTEAYEVSPEELEERLVVFNAIRRHRGIPAKDATDFDSSSANPAVLFGFRNMGLFVPIDGYKIVGDPQGARTRYRHTSNVQFPLRADSIWSPSESPLIVA